jgi:hypothetical protein
VAIVWCQISSNITSLLVSGSKISGAIITKTTCDQTERNFWTKSDSPGNVLPLQPALLPPM